MRLDQRNPKDAGSRGRSETQCSTSREHRIDAGLDLFSLDKRLGHHENDRPP